jgi:hypothetical protein
VIGASAVPDRLICTGLGELHIPDTTPSPEV